MEDPTCLLSGTDTEEELSLQEEIGLDLTGSAIRGQRSPAALPQGAEVGLHSGLGPDLRTINTLVLILSTASAKSQDSHFVPSVLMKPG